MITIDISVLMVVCTCIVTVAGAIGVFCKLGRKVMNTDEIKHIKNCLDRDKSRLIRSVVADFGPVYADEYTKADPRNRVLANKRFANFLYETLSTEISDDSTDTYKKALIWLVHNKTNIDPSVWAHGVLLS